jgi:hypothetical protein
MIAVLVVLVLIWDHFTGFTDLLIIDAMIKRSKQGKIAFEANQSMKHSLASGARDASFDASGIALLADVRLSDIVQLKISTSTEMQRKNFDGAANSVLLDRIAIDDSGLVVAALAIKGAAPRVVFEVLRSVNIKAFSDRAGFDAEVERHASRQTAPSQI